MNQDQTNLSPAEAVLAEKPTENSRKSWKDTFSTVLLFGGALLTAFMLNIFVFQSYEVEGQSMSPTLQNKDRLIIYKFNKTWSKVTKSDYLPDRGDIIVFHKPNGSSDQLIKRVIGLPGDRVVVKNDKITIFNQQNPNGFNPDDAEYGGELLATFGNVDVVVGENEVFVCGDNRIPGASYDSRSTLGNVSSEFIVGELVLRYLPFGNFRSF
jgi:signal peptidase I